ncbi:MAG: hypothetical protein ABL936_08975 [Aestuariivirga sp.]
MSGSPVELSWRNNAVVLPVKKKPTNLLGYDILPLPAKDLGAGSHARLQEQSNHGKSPNTGDVAEWLKATVC